MGQIKEPTGSSWGLVVVMLVGFITVMLLIGAFGPRDRNGRLHSPTTEFILRGSN